jgi:hypothetical protein
VLAWFGGLVTAEEKQATRDLLGRFVPRPRRVSADNALSVVIADE